MKKMATQCIIKKTKAAAQRGVSNIQVAIVILVGILLLLGGLSGYRYIEQTKINNEIETMNAIKSAVVRQGQFGNIYDIRTVADAAAHGFFSNTTIKETEPGSGIYKNQWGGNVAIDDGGENFFFLMHNIPQKVCIELGTKLDSVAYGIYTVTADIKPPGQPSSFANAINACQTDGLTMYMTFKK